MRGFCGAGCLRVATGGSPVIAAAAVRYGFHPEVITRLNPQHISEAVIAQLQPGSLVGGMRRSGTV